MAAAVETDHIHRLTAAQYVRLADAEPALWAGTELVRGVVYDVSPEHRRHATAVGVVRRRLEAVFPPERVYTSGSVRTGEVGVPLPDLFVIAEGTAVDADGPFTAAEVELVVEVAASSQWRDLTAKPADYAAGGIPAYWVVDLEASAVVRHLEPGPRGYRRIETVDLPEGVTGPDVPALLDRP
jgi:Uma2 family endonuclease